MRKYKGKFCMQKILLSSTKSKKILAMLYKMYEMSLAYYDCQQKRASPI